MSVGQGQLNHESVYNMIGVDKAIMNAAILNDKRQATNWGPIWYQGLMVFSSNTQLLLFPSK